MSAHKIEGSMVRNEFSAKCTPIISVMNDDITAKGKIQSCM